MDMNAVFMQIVYSLVIAIVYGLAWYFKTYPREQFDSKMFVKTLIIAVFVAIIMLYFDLDYTTALEFVTTNFVLMYLIDQIVNAIFQFKPPVALIRSKR